MDLVANNPETNIEKINLYTLSAFVPLLDERKADIDKIEKKTFKYGERYRHNLDVYYPSEPKQTPQGKVPILFFIYGGGYNTGSRQFPAPYDMGYRALGSFFAQRGYVTIIPDYRLVPEVRFPAASEDIRDAVVWVSNNAETIKTGSIEPDPGYIFIMGHSAGAAHTHVMTMHPEIRVTLPPLKGLIFSGGPWFFSVRGEKFQTEGPVKFYFGSAEQQQEREPRALWNKLSDEEIKALPDILLFQAEREPDWLQLTRPEILADMEKRLGKAPKMIIGKGHNHVSPNWALCSGQGEEWGYEVAEWLNEKIAS
ncbi:hypothetical protein HYDPIDRAFT_84006 [Hydnomerulius pinastri MD-312]|nr:hypothetical protein HYDPIDRAFT_84006 [Hydnomerulius pinastri MD-312]